MRLADLRGVARRTLFACCLVGVATLPGWWGLRMASAPGTVEGVVAPAQEATGQYTVVGWELLGGFAYDLTPPGAFAKSTPGELALRNQQVLPERVRALDGDRASLRGFMIPTDIEQGRVTAFILAAKNEIGCCFGDGLAFNQWVAVRVPDGVDVPGEYLDVVTVRGRLEVGEEVVRGTVTSLYRMEAEEVRHSG